MASIADDGGFKVWLKDTRQQLVADKILSPKTAEVIFAGISWQPKVLVLDRRQPEKRLSTATYLKQTIRRQRITDGKKFLHEKNELLKDIEHKYHVPGRFLLALWAMETNYGRLTGGYRVLDALATLAHEGRRAAFFRDEFVAALKILDETGMTPARMTGSWAGAMGQCQFMPTTFVKYAVDMDGNGRREIWSSRADVLGSAAHYLHKLGWDGQRGWGRRVQIPHDLATNLINIDSAKTLAEWHKIGVRKIDGKDLPRAPIVASLIQPDGPGTPAYLVYDNFKLLLKWNRSIPFALSVGILADHIGENF